MPTKPTQTQSGKAFEYALINGANIILSSKCEVNLIQDTNYATCLDCYNIHTDKQQLRYTQAAKAALEHIITLEPRLSNISSSRDILTIQLQPDSAGKEGDVRDVLFIRSSQNWEIGISAKNNHEALKHSRLSNVNDFGKSWVGVQCSNNYFNVIKPVFAELVKLRQEGVTWRSLTNKHTTYYQPILNAFRDELSYINKNNSNIPQALASYLIGKHDFYKVIKRARVVEIFAFNLHGTLGRSINGLRGISNIPKLMLPTQIVQFQMMQGKTDTLSMICDKGWQLSFRIHNATTKVEASLKFDVNLEGVPNSMYSNHIPY
ncbi:MAG: HaeIII family restriction endonuclease [Bacteroidetes bacterium]|nr:HaeIII family restriction endonuclease [Bacteroidota bacterium]